MIQNRSLSGFPVIIFDIILYAFALRTIKESFFKADLLVSFSVPFSPYHILVSIGSF